jgi:lipopolysaccharide biosynthesis protein
MTEAGSPRSEARARVLAFHLPQFYPTPENDEWWGRGFTEWTNVASAQPLFPGHDQPRVPTELGFYDLRNPEALAAQSALATEHGIEGFCFWHYWFGGRRLLDRPVREILASGEPRAPFCLAWANQPWTRTWLGSGETLMPQPYSIDDDVEHGRWLAATFADERYLRVDGRPLFGVYRPGDLPDAARTCDTWREICTRAGVGDPFLVGINAFALGVDQRENGFDATLDFQPALGFLPHTEPGIPPPGRIRRNLRLGVRDPRLYVYDDAEARRLMNRRAKWGHHTIPSVMVGWDNTARRGKRAIVVVNSTPEALGRSLDEAIASVVDQTSEHRLVFINAWNEWAEGNYLEPDVTHGRSKLEAVARSILA